MGPFGSHCFFMPLKYISAEWSRLYACIGMLSYVMLFYVCCILLDKGRIFICKPMNNWLTCKSAYIMKEIDSVLIQKVYIDRNDKK